MLGAAHQSGSAGEGSKMKTFDVTGAGGMMLGQLDADDAAGAIAQAQGFWPAHKDDITAAEVVPPAPPALASPATATSPPPPPPLPAPVLAPADAAQSEALQLQTAGIPPAAAQLIVGAMNSFDDRLRALEKGGSGSNNNAPPSADMGAAQVSAQ